MVEEDKRLRSRIVAPGIDSGLAGAGDGSQNRVANPSGVSSSAGTDVAAEKNRGELPDVAAGQSSQSGVGAGQTESTAGTRYDKISTSVPDEYKGETNKELIGWLRAKMAEHEPKSKEDLEKLRRKQRAEGIVAGITDATRAVANLWFTNKYAPNMYDANNGMSAKAKARFDKAKAEREAEDDRYYNYAINLAKLLRADREQALKIHNMEQNYLRQERAHDDSRADKAAETAYRNAKLEYDRKKDEWQQALKDKNYQLAEKKYNQMVAHQRAMEHIGMYNATHKGSGGSGRGSDKCYGTLIGPDGKEHAFRTKADYDAALNEWSPGTAVTSYKVESGGEREAPNPPGARAAAINKQNRGKGKYSNTAKIKW